MNTIDEINEMIEEVEAERLFLEEKLIIHSSKLAVNAQEQCKLSHAAGLMKSDVLGLVKNIKLNIEEQEALTTKSAMSDPDAFGLVKATVDAVKSAVASSPNIVALKRGLIKAETELEKCNSLYNSYQHRKSMIQEEVKLYLSNYWDELAVEEMDEQVLDVKKEMIKRKKS